KEDENLFRKSGWVVPAEVIPVGLELDDYPDQSNAENGLSLFHLGSMDWLPNLEGVQWLLAGCWPLIHQEFPTLKLYLAGRGFPDWLIQQAPANVICEGEILDAKKFMRDKQVMVVPLKSGGGMRVKIIQGMALGKTIISTTIGAEGIMYEDGKNILIADTPAEILSRVEQCLAEKEFCFRIG